MSQLRHDSPGRHWGPEGVGGRGGSRLGPVGILTSHWGIWSHDEIWDCEIFDQVHHDGISRTSALRWGPCGLSKSARPWNRTAQELGPVPRRDARKQSASSGPAVASAGRRPTTVPTA